MTRSFLDRFYSFIAYIQGCIQEFVQGGGALHPLGFHWSRGELSPNSPRTSAFIFYQGQNFA